MSQVECRLFSVLVDRVSPTPPDLSQPASPRKTSQWTWASGGGGSGSFQCQLDVGATFTCTSPYNLPSPTDGSHTLKVRELDAAGNMSTYSSTTVVIDLQVPIINLTNFLSTPSQIFNTVSAFEGKATDDRQMKNVWVKIGSDSILASGSNPFSVIPTLKSGTQTLTFLAEDIAGNIATTQVTITFQPDVIFVRKGAIGTGNGSSWANAFTDLGQVLKYEKLIGNHKQIWVAEGEYFAPSSAGFIVHSGESVFGNFASNGTERSVESRVLGNRSTYMTNNSGSTALSNLTDKSDGNGEYSENISVSDFNFKSGTGGDVVNLTKVRSGILDRITITGIKDINSAIYLRDSRVDLNNSYIGSNTTFGGGLDLISGYVRIRNTIIYANGGNCGINIQSDGEACVGSGSSISNNDPFEIFVPVDKIAVEKIGVTIGPNGVLNGMGQPYTPGTVNGCKDPF